MVQRILDDDKGGAPQERTQSERQFRAKPFRRFGNIPLLLEVFVEFRGFTALIQRDGKKEGQAFGSALVVEDLLVRT